MAVRSFPHFLIQMIKRKIGKLNIEKNNLKFII